MMDVYRPLTVMLDALEFAALRAMNMPDPYDPGVPFGPRCQKRISIATPIMAPSVMDAIRAGVTCIFAGRISFETYRSARSRVTHCDARCACGATFSLVPLDERDQCAALSPTRVMAEWLIDGIGAHRCEVYP